MLIDYATLRFIWWVLIFVLIAGFAIADGFVFGVGMLLYPVGRSSCERQIMINSILPHWEGNQVWLITTAGAIFAAWPTVYSITFSAFYIAIILVLTALFFRPIGFAYRQKIANHNWYYLWDMLITLSSILAIFILGVACGNIFLGIPFAFDQYLRPTYYGSLGKLFNAFTLLCGLLSILVVLMQAGTWLQLKCQGLLQRRARTIVMWATGGILCCCLMIAFYLKYSIAGYNIISHTDPSATSLNLNKKIVCCIGGWLVNFRRCRLLCLIPLNSLLLLILTWIATWKRHCGWSFLASSLTIASLVSTVGAVLFPFVMPSSMMLNHSLTLWDASSSSKTLSIMLWITLTLLPIVLSYTIWSYAKMSGYCKNTSVKFAKKSHY